MTHVLLVQTFTYFSVMYRERPIVGLGTVAWCAVFLLVAIWRLRREDF